MALLLLVPAIALAAVIRQEGNFKEAAVHYQRRIDQFRKDRAEELMKNEGWLAVAGLFWLDEGDNSIGTDPKNKIVLPTGGTALHVGVVTLHDGKVTLKIAPDASVAVQNQPAHGEVELRADDTRADMGDLTVMVIRRGKRVGLRLFDLDSRGRREFDGLKWFPIDPAYRVAAKYVAYPTPRTLMITNVLGDTGPVANPGYVEFTLEGKPCRLEAEAQGNGFFFNFHDLTSGKETYPAGRFLTTGPARDGVVDLDFNQAVNPPCAFTAFATCPLPPKDNFLNVAIRAGEKTHHPVSD